MKLYDSKLAPNPRRVRIFLAEKGVTIDTVQVDIATAENRKPEFLKLNPSGGVPVLQLDDGTYLSETVAICRYIEETHPEPALFGKGAKERALVEMWQRRMEFEVFLPIAQTFRNTHKFFAGRIPQVAEYGEVCRKGAVARLAQLDEELGSKEFIAGDTYTIADITALCGIDFGKPSGIRIDESHKNLLRWHSAVSGRPSARA
jgi:glutathione S-transferase